MPVKQYLVTYSTAVSDGEIPPYSKIQKTLRRRFERDPNVSVSVEELLTTQEAQDRYVFMAEPSAEELAKEPIQTEYTDDQGLGDIMERIQGIEARLEEGLTTVNDNLNRRIDTLTVRLNKITGIRLYDDDPPIDTPYGTITIGQEKIVREPGLHGTGDLTVDHVVVEDGGEVELPGLRAAVDQIEDEEWIPNPVPQETAMDAADFLETDGQMLARLGTDAQNWAQEFMRIIGPNPVDEGLMVSWFANAIESGRSAGQMKAPVSVAVLHTQSFESWKAIIGESIHTAFRKAGNSMAATQAHLNIKSMTAAEWDTILSFVVDWLERAGWVEVRHGEVQ